MSDVASNLDVTHDFSYEIVSRAVDVLAEAYKNAEDISDIDIEDFQEPVDAIVPVYTYDLLKIATVGNYEHIDEAREVFGNELLTAEACSIAWFSLVENATQQIHEAIMDYNNED